MFFYYLALEVINYDILMINIGICSFSPKKRFTVARNSIEANACERVPLDNLYNLFKEFPPEIKLGLLPSTQRSRFV